jgi:hypothetical protein
MTNQYKVKIYSNQEIREIIKTEVQELVTRGAGYDEIKAVAHDLWVCVLSGQIKARVADLPRALEGGDYHTTNWGRLATIEESHCRLVQ